MVNQQVLAGHWNELRGKLKEKWGKLTDDDLLSFNGNVDQLVDIAVEAEQIIIRQLAPLLLELATKFIPVAG